METEKRRSDAGDFRDGGKQFASVAVLWLVEDLLGVTDFQELAGTHDGDARGDLRHHRQAVREDRKSTRLNSSHSQISYAVFCLNNKKDVSCVVPNCVSFFV